MAVSFNWCRAAWSWVSTLAGLLYMDNLFLHIIFWFILTGSFAVTWSLYNLLYSHEFFWCRINENSAVFSVVEKHLKPGPWNHSLRQFCDQTLDSLKFFVRKYSKVFCFDLILSRFYIFVLHYIPQKLNEGSNLRTLAEYCKILSVHIQLKVLISRSDLMFLIRMPFCDHYSNFAHLTCRDNNHFFVD